MVYIYSFSKGLKKDNLGRQREGETVLGQCAEEILDAREPAWSSTKIIGMIWLMTSGIWDRTPMHVHMYICIWLYCC